MDLRAIKELAEKYSSHELRGFADELEATGTCLAAIQKPDPGDMLSDLLQAAEVRKISEGGQSLQEAVRAFSKRVRNVLT